MERFANVFSPLQVKRLGLKNRLVMAPMGTGFGNDDGTVSARTIEHYLARARGGVGLIVQEATAVRADGLGRQGLLGIWDEAFLPGLRALVAAVHGGGAKIAVQLYHAGRRTSATVIGRQPVAPSAVNCALFPELPRALSMPEIVALEDAFAEAAARAVTAGYDAVEVHGAHDYLVNQFMSPLTNRREDDYGGDLDGRLRFPRNVLAKILRVVGPEYPILFRISADQYVAGGLTLADNQTIVPHLIAAGADVIHVSAASTSAEHIFCAPMAVAPGNLLTLAAGIKQVATVPVIAVGRIVDVALAEEVLRTGTADLVAMGRALLADPELPNKAREGRLEDIRPCIGCHQGCRSWPIGCLANPRVGRERELEPAVAQTSKKVVVLGGGPAGLEAARVAAQRGHRVTIFEQEAQLGGRLRAAGIAPGKQGIANIVDFLGRQVENLGVELRLGAPATLAAVQALNPEAVVVATGGQPIVPARPGIERGSVVVAEDVLLRGAPVGESVVVMGAGMTGCEVAAYLAQDGKRVTIVTRVARLEEVADDVPRGPRFLLLEHLRDLGVTILNGTELEEVGEGEVVLRRGVERATLAAETVVLAQGYRPNDALAQELRGVGMTCYVIGDAAEPRTAKEAVREGAEVGCRI